MLKFTLRQLEYATMVAETGSVVVAAERLGVAQPTLSAAIKKLEDQTGLQMFIRQHAQGLRATPQGRRFMAEARNLLSHADDLQRAAAAEGESVAGDLNIGSFLTLAPAYAPRLMSRFQALYPDARIRLEEGAQESLLSGLREGRHDLALLYRVDLPEDIRAVDVAVMAPYVLLPANHKMAQRSKIHLKSLAEEPLVLLDIQPSRTYFLRVLAQAGVAARPAFASPSMELVRGLVGQGLGYSLLITRPHSTRTYDGQKLCIRPIADEVEPGVIAIAGLRQMRMTRTASTFEAFCVKQFKSFRSSE